MYRTLDVIFRRNPARDRQDEKIRYEGYQVLWADETPVGFGADAFCKHGQRLLGLGKYLAGASERRVLLTCYWLEGRDTDLTRIPGHRVRRFYIERRGTQGRLHFLDGTPTAVVFDVGTDEQAVVEWIGLNLLGEGQQRWFDLAAFTVDDPVAPPVLAATTAFPSVVQS
ncbi:MAG TPA: hypothetical protein VKD72_30645 [Gemmataceae bacterium]|nr:hypothetical protein [Gemmataceae bacterium]